MTGYRHKMLTIAIYLLYGPRFFRDPPGYLSVGQHSRPRVATCEDKGPFGSGRPSFALFSNYLNSSIFYN